MTTKEKVINIKKKREQDVLIQKIKICIEEETLMLFHNIIGLLDICNFENKL